MHSSYRSYKNEIKHSLQLIDEAVTRSCSKKSLLKRTPSHVFFCEFCGIFPNNYSVEHL